MLGSLLDAFPLSASNGLTHASSVALNFDAFDFLERKFLAGEIVEFSSTWRFVVRDVLSVLQRASILQVNCNPVSSGAGFEIPFAHSVWLPS